jgi:hypothetical protein
MKTTGVHHRSVPLRPQQTAHTPLRAPGSERFPGVRPRDAQAEEARRGQEARCQPQRRVAIDPIRSSVGTFV